jgi:uncharacterized cupin superfamily protein
MSGVAVRSFSSPDETRAPAKTTVQIVRMGEASVARFTFEPGWRWSEHVRPAVGTETCQTYHVGAIVSGQLHVVHTDGSEADAGPGDAYVIAPGHDAWVVGDEPVVALEFASAEAYAKR